ncbi:Protein CBR-PHY-3 [Caenorhabditis briggsae]|uniref:Protein CBR-PHY-3 n=1 Tax=Caenorhabditis briggsae TaxID=6238 RepID=A8WKJ0_CAEBR|nr:Protein CBR-PHY-3 [Caenorhabditis briggsae]CAP20985.2 Protein CBR-PHY-3 [Caenorhabditis briggsae]
MSVLKKNGSAEAGGNRGGMEWHMNVNENALLGAKERMGGNSKPIITFCRTQIANGSFIDHGENEITSEVHKKVTKRIPALNFQSAELFSALSYIPGGHYAVHYDYLSYRSDKEHDWWMQMMRNRIGTLIFVIKTAEKGGGTVFPSIGTTIKIDEGDAFFWFNAQADESQEMLSDHGGCPIYSGRKVIATLWIRAKDQPVIPMAASGSPIDASWMIPSFSSAFRSDQKSQTPVEH